MKDIISHGWIDLLDAFVYLIFQLNLCQLWHVNVSHSAGTICPGIRGRPRVLGFLNESPWAKTIWLLGRLGSSLFLAPCFRDFSLALRSLCTRIKIVFCLRYWFLMGGSFESVNHWGVILEQDHNLQREWGSRSYFFWERFHLII